MWRNECFWPFLTSHFSCLPMFDLYIYSHARGLLLAPRRKVCTLQFEASIPVICKSFTVGIYDASPQYGNYSWQVTCLNYWNMRAEFPITSISNTNKLQPLFATERRVSGERGDTVVKIAIVLYGA